MLRRRVKRPGHPPPLTQEQERELYARIFRLVSAGLPLTSKLLKFSCSRIFWEHRYCHVLVTRHGVWIDKWIYWMLITRNYK
jgi:hypothetical protein